MKTIAQKTQALTKVLAHQNVPAEPCLPIVLTIRKRVTKASVVGQNKTLPLVQNIPMHQKVPAAQKVPAPQNLVVVAGKELNKSKKDPIRAGHIKPIHIIQNIPMSQKVPVAQKALAPQNLVVVAGKEVTISRKDPIGVVQK